MPWSNVLFLCTDYSDSLIDGVPVRVTTFEPTETMSTYLLAFLVSEFISIQSSQNHLLVRYIGFAFNLY